MTISSERVASDLQFMDNAALDAMLGILQTTEFVFGAEDEEVAQEEREFAAKVAQFSFYLATNMIVERNFAHNSYFDVVTGKTDEEKGDEQ
jgi:VIT1/CCC1 family predicted Fe2+/Mn2+ transporter